MTQHLTLATAKVYHEKREKRLAKAQRRRSRTRVVNRPIAKRITTPFQFAMSLVFRSK